MALARLDVPSLMLYGGSIAPGRFRGRDVTIGDVFEAIGAQAAGEISAEELKELEDCASPGPGACAGQFTANTMACAFEALGISPAGSAMVPGRGLDQGGGRGADRRAGDAGARRRPAPQSGDHPRVAGERDRLRLRLRRVDQRRPSPARGCARGGDRARDRRLRGDLQANSAARRPEAGRALRRHRPLPRRRRAVDPQPPRRGGLAACRRAHGQRPDDRRGGQRRRGGGGPGGGANAVQPAEARGRPGDPPRQSRAPGGGG